MRHQHYDIDNCVSAVRSVFNEARSQPNGGKNKYEIDVINSQIRVEAEDFRASFTKLYLTFINEGMADEIQARTVGVLLADCALDWLTGYDLQRGTEPANAIASAFCDHLSRVIKMRLNGEPDEFSVPINAVQSGTA